MNWISWLVDSRVFNTRNTCGIGWTDQMISFYQLANLLIALAYFAIPISLAGLYFKINKLKSLSKISPWILLMFVSFISLCGLTHIAHVVVFWWAPYRLFALLDFLTAAVSIITAIILPLVVYDLIKVLPNDQRTQSDP